MFFRSSVSSIFTSGRLFNPLRRLWGDPVCSVTRLSAAAPRRSVGDRAMSLPPLLSRVNPTTGAAEWVVEDEGFDFHQEIARSAYTDMLHDDERNKKYYEGIRRAVRIQRERGVEVRVLDVGTGTGLLAMMAAACGADTVYACEAFPPIAAAAERIIAENGFADKITVIPKRSTELTVGPDGDMPARANILAAEVFDTELIGEGAIPTYQHARKHLLTDDCICVPHYADVYALVVQSDLIWQWHKLQPIRMPRGGDIMPPADMESCSGAASVHDLQLSQLGADSFRQIMEPQLICSFNFSNGQRQLEEKETWSIDDQSLTTGICQGVFMWWELCMDTKGEVMLSTAPSWCRDDGGGAPWRDHWMQAVYFLDRPVSVEKGDSMLVTMRHDAYSQWFDVQCTQYERRRIGRDRPVCHCGAHAVWSRPRFGMINDQQRTQKYISAMEKVITSDSVCLSIGDGSMLPLIAARLGAKKVYSCEPTSLSAGVMDKMIEHNQLGSKVKLLKKRAQDLGSDDLDGRKIDVLLAEPFFITSLLPWHNLYLWYAWAALQSHLAPSVKLLPGSARLMGIAVQFDHLWKFHAPVKTVEGFDVRIFDEIVQKSSECADAPTEPHHLWEYPGQPLTQAFEVMTFDFSKAIPSEKVVRDGTVGFVSSGSCHGVALWLDYQLDAGTEVSTGLQRDPAQTGGELVWDRHSKQGVHFIKTNPRVGLADSLRFEASFSPASGNMHFSFAARSGGRVGR